MTAMTVGAVVLMVLGASLVLRAVVVVARGQNGLVWFDLPLCLLGGFALALLGQELVNR